VNVKDFPIATELAGVQMRLVRGGVRELHWHPATEWAYVMSGTCRITAIDEGGKAFVEDVSESDLWLFPSGRPHSIQGLGDDGCFFLLVFNDAAFSESATFLLTDWMSHVPLEVLAKNFQVPKSTFANLPQQELYMFATELPRPLEVDQRQAALGTGFIPESYAFFASQMEPNYTRLGGEVKIIDKRNFPVTKIAASIVTLKPGGLRELHWHPNGDEWTYFVTGKARVGVFQASQYPAAARTMDFQEGDIGYIKKDNPHYIENTADVDLVFLEVFAADYFEDISLAEWLAHTPSRLVNEHIRTGEAFINSIYKYEAVNVNDFPIAVNMAGVQMRLFSGAVRELHWHPENEWAFVFFGTCRVTLVDEGGYAYVGDVTASDLWFFPAGRPHSIQGLGDDGCFFLLVFDSGNFSEADTFLLTDWMGHVPLSVLSKNFQVPESVFKNLPTTELYMFASELPRPLKVEQHEVAIGTGLLNESIAFYTTQMKPNYTRLGGNVKIIDNANFPITTIAAAIVTLKPGGLRELHWHPNADEWTYFVSGMARVGMFEAGNYPANSRTMDFQEGDIGYIPKDNPHYVENTGDCDLIFLEVFPSPTFQDISLAEWLAHTPTRLVNEHIHTGEAFINAIYNKEAVIRPL
ncbi:unnamed protein product, partial [Oppiella nova]